MSEQEAKTYPPSINELARSIRHTGVPWALLVDAARLAVQAGDPDIATELAHGFALSLIRPVVNGTGVLLHTNLGRARLGRFAIHTGPANLEISLETGKRSPRGSSIGMLLKRLIGCEDAIVVNNGAAAVLLAVAAIARGKKTFVSRGECVEIGGNFRIPDVVAAAGTELVDVGTTNRTKVSDFRDAVANGGDTSGCILRVHTSNFRIDGFTQSAPIDELATLGVPVLFDLGSGLLDSKTPWLRGAPPVWLSSEPGAKQALRDGASLVTFSCDKLLGGPQAGVIAGDADLVQLCAREPIFRALRPSLQVLSALQDTLLAYIERDCSRLPFWASAMAPLAQLENRAYAIVSALKPSSAAEVVSSRSVVGAGASPGAQLQSCAVSVPLLCGDQLRRRALPVIALHRGGHTLCDLRSVLPEEDHHVRDAFQEALGA